MSWTNFQPEKSDDPNAVIMEIFLQISLSDNSAEELLVCTNSNDIQSEFGRILKTSFTSKTTLHDTLFRLRLQHE
jgi:hypothetical protein